MSSCLGVLLELRIPDILAKEDKPIALKEVSRLFNLCRLGAETCLQMLTTSIQA